MKKIKTILFCLLIIICNKSFSQTQSQTQSVCSIDAIPRGWVVTNIDKKCVGCCDANAGEPGISYTITEIDEMPVGSIVFVCVKDDLPYGWIVVSTNTKCVACCGADKNEKGTNYQIKRIS